MIKPMALPEVLKRMSGQGDPDKLKVLLLQAAQEVRGFPRSYPWQSTGLHVSAGARIEVRAWGRGARWRLNGFAPDGSDVK